MNSGDTFIYISKFHIISTSNVWVSEKISFCILKRIMFKFLFPNTNRKNQSHNFEKILADRPIRGQFQKVKWSMRNCFQYASNFSVNSKNFSTIWKHFQFFDLETEKLKPLKKNHRHFVHHLTVWFFTFSSMILNIQKWHRRTIVIL